MKIINLHACYLSIDEALFTGYYFYNNYLLPLLLINFYCVWSLYTHHLVCMCTHNNMYNNIFTVYIPT